VRNRTKLKKRLLVTLISAAVSGATVMPAIGWAQSADANLRGAAPPNAEITAKNTATGATRRTTSSADGSYALVGLPPGTYSVSAAGGATQTVTLSVASTGTLNLVGEAPAGKDASQLEGITVTAAALTEVKTSEVGNTVSLRQIQTVPQITRNFLEFADTVPGMVFQVDSAGHTSLKSGGQNANSVNVYIDGVGQKNYVKEGGVAGQFNSQGNPFPQLAIGEYKVITSNYKAEYDQVSSAAVTAETKSGTNEFHGEIFNTYTDDSYRADTPAELAANKKTPSQEKEYGIAVGGPIIQDQLHFFFTYEAKRYDTPITVVPGVTTTDFDLTQVLPPDVRRQLGPANLPFTEDLYFGKLDWEFSDRDRVELSAKVRREDQADNIGTTNAVSASTLVTNNDDRFDLRWQHSADHWFNELLLTHEKTFNSPGSLNNGNGIVYVLPRASGDGDIILNTGAASPLATQNKGQKGPAIEDNLTFNDLNWMGSHTVKMGAKFKKVDLTAQDAGDNNAQFFYDVYPDHVEPAPFKAFFTNPVPGLSPVAKSSTKQYGLYIQDDWAVNEKLTLNLGVRWDYEDNASFLNYRTPQNVIDAINSQDPNGPAGQTYRQSLALGGVNIDDYISNGHNRNAQKDEFQPRLGFSYDLNADEEHVIFGGAGRSYDRNLYDYLQLELTKAALPQFTVYFDQPDHPCPENAANCVAWDPRYLNGLPNLQALVSSSNRGQEVDVVNNNIKTPYSDQFSLGMRNKVGDWNTSAAVARILSKDGFVFTLGNRRQDGSFWLNGDQPWGNGIPGFGSLIIGNSGIETKTTQVLLSADKPYTKDDGWGVSFAYTYTDAKQNRDIKEHYSFDEETINDYPFIQSNSVGKHRCVATASTDLPWGLLLSGKLTLETAVPNNQFQCYHNPNDGSPSYPVFSTGSHCTPIAPLPSGERFGIGGKIWGYRSVDFALQKNFDFTQGLILYVRADFLNIFNFKNYSDYTQLNRFGFDNYAVQYNPTGNIFGSPRAIKVTAGFRF
jgi:outer membrane receptor protein involved in Fe transport